PGEVGGDEALADPALAAHHDEHAADGGQPSRQPAALGGDLLAEAGAIRIRQLVVGADIEWHSPGIMPSFSAPGYARRAQAETVRRSRTAQSRAELRPPEGNREGPRPWGFAGELRSQGDAGAPAVRHRPPLSPAAPPRHAAGRVG